MKRRLALKQAFIISLIVALAIIVPLTSGCLPGKQEAAPPTEEAPPTETAPPTEAPPEPIVIGAPLPITGAPASDAVEIERGLSLGVEDLNARGGLLGRPVEYVTADVVDWGAVDQVAARDYLLTKDVDLFLPGYGLDPAFMDIFAAEETGGIPYLHYGTTELFAEMWASNPDKYWNILQIDDTSITYSPNVYEVMTRAIPNEYEYPNKTVAILTSQITYNQEISAGLRDLINADPEWEVVVDEEHPFGTQEFGVQLSKIREHNPGFIFFSTVVVPEGVAFVRQFLSNPSDSLVVVHYCPSNVEFRKMLGDQSIGILWQTSEGPPPTKTVFDYRERYIDTFGEEPGFCQAYAVHDAVMFWAQAVEAVGDVEDYEGIIDQFMRTSIGTEDRVIMAGMTQGPAGLNVSPLSGTDRTVWRNGMTEWDKENRPEGKDVGTSMTFSQIKATSDGPQDVITYIYDMPTEEYMQAYYGVDPFHKYLDEVGAEFVLPPWLE